MSELHAIVYVSSATHLLSQKELEDLLCRARARNLTENVSGLLLYCDGNFMQYIEGPREPLLSIYQLICADNLHKGLIELLNEPIISREFAGWSMAYAPVQMQNFIELSQASWKRIAETQDSLKIGYGRMLLRNFWLLNQLSGD